MENRKIEVQNRNGGRIFYQIPDERIYRSFTNKETKMIDLDELKKLQFVDGGEYMLKNCLIIKDKEALKELNLDVEPEYFYTEEEVTEILTNGSLDQLEDMLNFAPKGVIDLVHQIGVRIELPDTRKRKMIFDKTGFNIDGAVIVNKALEEPSEKENNEENKKKETAPVRKAETAKPVRKAAVVVKK